MSRLIRQKKITAIGAVCLLLAAAGAYAYWTAAGSGSANGTASSGGTITLTGSVDAGIAPGLGKTVNFAATNATTSAIQVGTVSLVSVAVDAEHSECNVADFTMPNVVSGQSVAAGAVATPLVATGTLTMANTSVNQDACKGATLTLTLAST